MSPVGSRFGASLKRHRVPAWVRAPGTGLVAVGLTLVVVANLAGGWRGFTEDRIELAGALIAVIGWLAYVAARRTERKRVEGVLRQSQTELRALARHLESVREEEHTKMGREIHDELAQSLTALRLDLSWLTRKVPDTGSGVRAKLAEMVTLTDATIEAGRRIAAELRPPILDDLGLVPALEWYTQDFAQRSGLCVAFDVEATDLPVDRQLSVMTYRIVQEALANVARHAQAKRVTVRLGASDGSLTLEISDDGKGIPDEEAASPRSLGLVGMRERALARGGVLEVTGTPRHGTTLRVTTPIERRREPRDGA